MLFFLLIALVSCSSAWETTKTSSSTTHSFVKGPGYLQKNKQIFSQSPPEIHIKHLKLLLFTSSYPVRIEATNLQSNFIPIKEGRLRCAYRKQRWQCLSAGRWYPLVDKQDNSFTTATGFIKVNNKFYREHILLHPQGRKLYVLNRVQRQHYLATVIKK